MEALISLSCATILEASLKEKAIMPFVEGNNVLGIATSVSALHGLDSFFFPHALYSKPNKFSF